MALRQARATAPPPKVPDLVLKLRVKQVVVDRVPRSCLSYVVRGKVLDVLRGSLPGRRVDFRIHSPTRAAVSAGAVVFVGARRAGKGYRVDDTAIGPLRGGTQARVFRAPGCARYRCRRCTAAFGARSAATRAGYRPCQLCKP